MQRTIVLVLLATSVVFAQTDSKTVVFTGGKVGAIAGFGPVSVAPVQRAPYTATITNESVQTLADGNRIVQTSTATTARDSMGRTRQDMPLPTIGNMSPANAPQIVFIQDPVAQTSYTLNLTDKTAMKMPPFMPLRSASVVANADPEAAPAAIVAGGRMVTRVAVAPDIALSDQIALNERAQTFALSGDGEFSKPQTEDLGSQTMEGMLVNGTRNTMTIPAGQIGNDKPISIVTEIWTSPELKTIVYSKRSDPRVGDQTFKLTNIIRAEPDPSLFTVPPDFTTADAPRPIQYQDRPRPRAIIQP